MSKKQTPPDANLPERSEKATTESRLQPSSELFKHLFDNAGDAIFIHDREGYVIEVNHAACARLGYSRDELLTMHPRDFNTPEQASRVAGRLEALRRDGVVTFETTHVARDGTQIPTEVISRLFQYEGSPTVLSTARDNTQRVLSEERRRRLEAQLLQAQKLEAVGTLAGGIAHDFRNLLQVIQAHAELLLGDEISEDRRRAGLQKIRRATKRGAALTFQLLAYSSKMESNLRPIDLNREVAELRRFLVRSLPKNIAVELALGAAVGLINADAAQTEQVLLNLALNASDAMPSGGTLRIETDVVSVLSSGYDDHPDGEAGTYALLRVSDTGCGMTEETMQQILDPFFTTKPVGHGTGLGLSSAYGIIKNHSGHVAVTSRLGVGTTFTIFLPRCASSLRPSAQETPVCAEQEAAGDGTVLIVDDDKAVLEPAIEYLSYRGYNVISASSGEEALEVYGRHGQQVDVVILDLGMPGMGGRICLDKLIERDPQAKVIVASGYAELVGAPESILKAGAKTFVPKPYHLAEMERAVRNVLE